MAKSLSSWELVEKLYELAKDQIGYPEGDTAGRMADKMARRLKEQGIPRPSSKSSSSRRRASPPPSSPPPRSTSRHAAPPPPSPPPRPPAASYENPFLKRGTFFSEVEFPAGWSSWGS